MENALNEISGKPMKERKRILDELGQKCIGNETNKRKRTHQKDEKKLEPKKEEDPDDDEFANLPNASSGAEDTDIEIKEEEP
jgi:hypothetical protein